MKKMTIAVLSLVTLLAAVSQAKNQNYPGNSAPLLQTSFVSLPVGAVKPAGWLNDQLTIQANGLTGHLDEFWPSISESAWKGGTGDAWERGPYWLDGIVPLAYILDDARLKEKIKPFIEWILASGQEDGWFGPANNNDRWPLAVALKVLTQYHEATGDERALTVIKNYAHYLATHAPDWPDKDWRGMRAMENLNTLYWLYRRTGDPEILQTAKSIQNNCFDWANYFVHFPWDSEAILKHQIPHNWGPVGLTAHVVNVAMAVKYPGVWYQQSKDEAFKNAVYEGLNNLDRHHGQVAGRFSGDEHISGTSPTQGTELCAVVELMYSLESLVEVLGDPVLADRLEILAYNAQPGACTPNYWAHQYDQQANQVLCSVAHRDWSTNGDSSNLYGLEPNYGCCTANMHQGWPKFVSHLWMATEDNGLAAVAYGPSVVNAKVADGVEVKIEQDTLYPFQGDIQFTVTVPTPTEFPIYLRIPAWAKGAKITIGETSILPKTGTFCALERTWKTGDTIQLSLPMSLRTETRYNNAVSILRGPLYFSLKIKEGWKQLKRYNDIYPVIDWEIDPESSWNYGLIIDRNHPDNSIQVETQKMGEEPFANATAPVLLKIKGKKISGWDLVNNSAGPTPMSPVKTEEPEEDLTLVPYGCTRLRITEFPTVVQ